MGKEGPAGRGLDGRRGLDGVAESILSPWQLSSLRKNLLHR